MQVIGQYSFMDGAGIMERERPAELLEVLDAIGRVDLSKCAEPGKPALSSPKSIADEILSRLYTKGWAKARIPMEKEGSAIEGDARKNGVGLEIQFGGYSFLGWDSFRKIAISGKHGIYRYGIEIAPMASLRRRMSQGVGSFEQAKEKLEKAGSPDLSVPVLLLGIDG
ncbi:MAG: BglII/BstYI family type II restriction endonuclease [Candidatus Aenigmatarchaeota archaeon]